MSSKTAKDFTKISHSHIKIIAQSNIIQIAQSLRPQQTTKYKLHRSLERSWGVTEAKAHHFMLKLAVLSNECNLMMVFQAYGNSPVTRR